MRWGTLLKKCPPDPPQNLLEKGFEFSEGWRAPVKVEGGHSHVRRRRAPPRPRRLAPMFLTWLGGLEAELHPQRDIPSIRKFQLKHPIRRGNVGVSRGRVSEVPDANEDWGA